MVFPVIKVDTDPLDEKNLRVALEAFGAGSISGYVSEWPQLKPALHWAISHIKKLEAELRKLEAQSFTKNRIGNCGNEGQGKAKRVLCVCSAGLLRSPTMAVILSQAPYHYNTRAVGLVKEFALIPIDKVLLEWADEIVCATEDQAEFIRNNMKPDAVVKSLDIPDEFDYMQLDLVDLIKERYKALK